MLHAILWPILTVWMGLAVLVLLSIIGMIIYGTVHLAYDALGRERGQIWCPPSAAMLNVRGTPRRFTAGDPPFATLRRCEAWGSGRGGRCPRACLKVAAAY